MEYLKEIENLGFGIISDEVAKTPTIQTQFVSDDILTFSDFVDKTIGTFTLSDRQRLVSSWLCGDDPKKTFENGNYMAILVYGKGCIHGSAKIWDPIVKEEFTVKQLHDRDIAPYVQSLEGEDFRTVAVRASVPFVKGEEEMFRIETERGNSFIATKEHAVRGLLDWILVKDLKPGTKIISGNQIKQAETYQSIFGNMPVHAWNVDYVRSITSIGIDTYYDLEVPGTQNYLADGIYHHNSGKDTLASLLFSYFAYLLLEMRDPAAYFGLVPHDEISMLNIAYSREQAKEVFFKKFTMFLKSSNYFTENYKIVESGSTINKPKMNRGTISINSNSVFFPKNIRMYSGHSQEEAQEGKNLLVCLTGDTKIKLINGQNTEIKELVGKEGQWAYSYDHSTGKITNGKIKRVWKTGEGRRVLKITLDTGESFKCTPDHKLMLRDGTYLEAEKAIVGQSLMPWQIENSNILNHKIVAIEEAGYEDVYDMEIENTHNFALSAGVFVHNCTLDELSAFSDANKTRNGGKIFRMIRSSSFTRFKYKCKIFVLSYPRYKNDVTMKLYDFYKKDLHVFTDKAATWEVLPKQSSLEMVEYKGLMIPVDYLKEFQDDVIDAFRKYACLPPEAEQPFMYEHEAAEMTFSYSNPSKVFEFEDYIEKVGDILKVRKRMKWKNSIVPKTPYIMTYDLGKSDCKAVITLTAQDTVKNTVSMDFTTYWQPDRAKGTKIDLENVKAIMYMILDTYKIVGVFSDHWNSALLMDEFQNKGIKSDAIDLSDDDYTTYFKLPLSAKKLLILNDRVLDKEIRSLDLIKGKKVGSTWYKDIVDTVVLGNKIWNNKERYLSKNRIISIGTMIVKGDPNSLAKLGGTMLGGNTEVSSGTLGTGASRGMTSDSLSDGDILRMLESRK